MASKAFLVEFGTRIPVYDPDGVDMNERIIGYDCTQSQRVVFAESEEALWEGLAGFDPETEEAPKLICELPAQVARMCEYHFGLAAALQGMMDARNRKPWSPVQATNAYMSAVEIMAKVRSIKHG